MYVIRPAKPDDFEGFFNLVKKTGAGITSLPNSQQTVKKRLEESLAAFENKEAKPTDQNYVFLLEDLETGEIGACCGILGNTNFFDLYSYKLETISLIQKFPQSIPTINTLHFVSGYNHASEICSLFLALEWRKKSLGKLLSLSRFLFIANNLERFEQNMIAVMRGAIDVHGENPFWNAISRHFVDLSYGEFSQLIQADSKALLDVIPKYPIYVPMLPKEAQEIIGKTHANTIPALNMLLSEGFSFTDHIDTGDGGPIISAETAHIKTVKDSQVYLIKSVVDSPIESPRYIISNVKMDFRASFGNVLIDNSAATLEKKVLDSLKLNIGDTIRIIEI